MKTSVDIRLPVDQAWQLVADTDSQQRWMGPGAHLQPIAGKRIQLSHEVGGWRSGVVTAVRQNETVECRLEPARGWTRDQGSSTLTITVASGENGRSRVTAEETGLLSGSGEPAPEDDAQAHWEAALSRLRSLANRVNDRRNNPRQAVIVIHGIGEQEPGATLKSFVDGLLRTKDPGIKLWSKPDRTSRFFELRKITVKASKFQVRPTTDIFELYWAHVIRDTTLSQVASWIRHLLFRRGVPGRFKPVWVVGWLLILAAFLLGVVQLAGVAPGVTKYVVSGGALFVTATVLWRLLGKSFVIDSIGDAARYLSPRPANIEHRQAIREAGVDLLETLHSQGNYDRITIVGHSLGSVIAYDIITHYWIRTHTDHLRLPKVSNTGVTGVERGLAQTHAAAGQRLQHVAWKVARSNSQPWLVTDFVTLGSPLSVADFLMASSKDKFNRARRDRELPTCPPVYELEKENRNKKRGDRSDRKKRVSFESAYEDRLGGTDKTIKVLHHAAPFALTRWTNLYFPNGLLGDPIGGRVAPHFGNWVRDVPLRPPKGRRFFLHTAYWRREDNDPSARPVFAALRLNSGRELLAELGKHSPLAYLPQ